MPPYQCKLCGCTQVYHSCATMLRARSAPCIASTDPTLVAAIVVAKPVTIEAPTLQPTLLQHTEHVQVLPEPQLDGPYTQSDKALTTPETTLDSASNASCVHCGVQSSTDHVYGMKWCFASQRKIRVRGDRLCRACRRHICDELVEYIPMPPSKPGGYLVVRSRNMKRVSRKDGVTLLWLAGKYMAAKELSGRSVLTVSRNIV